MEDFCHFPANHKSVFRVETYCCPGNLKHRSNVSALNVGLGPKDL